MDDEYKIKDASDAHYGKDNNDKSVPDSDETQKDESQYDDYFSKYSYDDDKATDGDIWSDVSVNVPKNFDEEPIDYFADLPENDGQMDSENSNEDIETVTTTETEDAGVFDDKFPVDSSPIEENAEENLKEFDEVSAEESSDNTLHEEAEHVRGEVSDEEEFSEEAPVEEVSEDKAEKVSIGEDSEEETEEVTAEDVSNEETGSVSNDESYKNGGSNEIVNEEPLDISEGNKTESTLEQVELPAQEERTISSDLIRGHINTIILRSLYDGDRYGYEIIAEIEKKSLNQYTLKQPSLYSALKRLEKDGYITSYWGGSVSGGRRKYFSLTDAGKEIAERNQVEWEYSRSVIDRLISDKEFDFSKPAPSAVNMRVLQKSTSRVPRVNSEDFDDYEDDSPFDTDELSSEKEAFEDEQLQRESDIASREEALRQDEEERTRREAELNEREEQISKEEQRFALLEYELTKREEELNEVEETNSRVESELNRREEELAKQEEHNTKLENELLEREAALQREEELHRERENELSSREEEIQKEGEGHSSREEELLAREEKLNRDEETFALRESVLNNREEALKQGMEEGLRRENELIEREEALKREKEAYEKAVQEAEQLHREQNEQLETRRNALEEEAERRVLNERNRYDKLLYEHEAALQDQYEKQIRERENYLLQKAEEEYRRREQILIHQNYLNLVNNPPDYQSRQNRYYMDPPQEQTAPAPEEDYRSVIQKLYSNSLKEGQAAKPVDENKNFSTERAEQPKFTQSAKEEFPMYERAEKAQPRTVQTKLRSLGGIDFYDLETRAARDGIRISTSGGEKKQKEEGDTLVHKGKALFFSALIVFFLCIAEGSIALGFQNVFALPSFYPYFIWGTGMALLLIMALAYVNRYGENSLRKTGNLLINVVVSYALCVIAILIIALAAQIDFSSASEVMTYIVFPIIYFFSIVVFGLAYYFQIRPHKAAK